ncbi:hypothetical protein SF12_01825 [Streptomyces sp. MBRL 601]|nr:hypothetical protein SF12_01825 [Streptomyces sp. MBRL 601]
MRDGGEALDVGAQELGEDLGLRLAELWELLGTCATGQWCWQSCSPCCGSGALRAVAAYPSALSAFASAWARSPGSASSIAARYCSAWAATLARAKEATASGPAVSAIQRSASAARES